MYGAAGVHGIRIPDFSFCDHALSLGYGIFL